jgi:hypothetical protein
LFEVRLPLGLWWLQKRQEKADANSASAAHTPQIKQRIGQPPMRNSSELATDDDRHTQNTEAAHEPAATERAAAQSGNPQPASAAGSSVAIGERGSETPTTAASAHATKTPGASKSGPGSTSAAEKASAAGSGKQDAVALDTEYATRLAEAKAAREKGDHLAEAFALSRAHALRPEPGVALQLVAAELALGRPRSAHADWRRLGDLEQLPLAERDLANQLKQKLAAALSYVRIELSGAVTSDLSISIDGLLEPIATQGYDVPLDPGPHTLQLRRADRLLTERAFETKTGALLRLSIEAAP